MSTSATIYNLKNKTGFYLDHAYWLDAPEGVLLTLTDLYKSILDSEKDQDERALAWLQALEDWAIEKNQNGVFVVLHDNDDTFDDLFKDYVVQDTN